MAAPASYVRQAAALPIRNGRICLVTSSNGKRWVIPKGQIEPGQTAGETALQEAWEEAGIVGTLHPEPIGSFVYEKGSAQYLVTVFVMEVTEMKQDWPERSIRQRVWTTPAGAVERLDDLGLIEIINESLRLTPDEATSTLG